MNTHKIFVKLKQSRWSNYHTASLDIQEKKLTILLHKKIIMDKQDYTIHVIDREQIKMTTKNNECISMYCMPNIEILDDLKRNGYTIIGSDNSCIFPPEPKSSSVLVLVAVLVIIQLIFFVIMNIIKSS